MKRVYFPDHLGRMLCGLLDEPGGGKAHHKSRKRKNDMAVIMLHGFCSDKSEGGKFDRVAPGLLKKGLAVLRFDFSGCGESDDAAICIRDQVTDARAALEYMKAKGYRRFGLLGMSLGGLIALRVRDHAIKARVLWAPLTRPKNVPIQYSFWDQFDLLVAGTKKIAKPERQWRKEMVVARRFFFEVRTISQRRLGRGIDTPVLIIHGDKDTHVPLGFSERMISFLPKSSKLAVLPGEDHYFKKEVPKLSKLSADWFMRNLG